MNAINHIGTNFGSHLPPEQSSSFHREEMLENDRARSRSVDFVFTTNSSDDASMWVRKPPAPPDLYPGGHVPREAEYIVKRLQRKGNNVHLPVLNVNEEVLARRSYGASGVSALTSAECFTPAQVVVSPNTATLRHLWKNWSITVAGAGAKLDPDRATQETFKSAKWFCQMRVADNLTLNSCIWALEEQELDARRGAEFRTPSSGDLTLIACHCAGHSGVLSTKSVLERGNVSGKLVRMFNQLSGGRRANAFQAALREVFQERFKNKPVVRLPPEVTEWSRAAAEVLRHSRPCRDLSEEDEAKCLVAFTSDWNDSDRFCHHCLPDCILGCNRNAEVSKRICTDLMVLYFGSPPNTPLAYRWKGMEAAAGWPYRGRSFGDIVYAAFQRMYPESSVKKALEELARSSARMERGEDQLMSENHIKNSTALLKAGRLSLGSKRMQASLVFLARYFCAPRYKTS